MFLKCGRKAGRSAGRAGRGAVILGAEDGAGGDASGPRCSRAQPGRGEPSGVPGAAPEGWKEPGMGTGVWGKRRGSGEVGNPDLSTATPGSVKMERRERASCGSPRICGRPAARYV